ncbi:PREDICTED: uncharacterized protein LOC107064237 [Polistes dominula]|uniref:Uncharacterized protein LOC107064237 n=1 Tax=Polistes dominula TaxID=743375 RepID=A0ABM1HW10_POLDO|nr:PREDICTED: uncharacterized protein LOC107064237 [Polistes dominula]
MKLIALMVLMLFEYCSGRTSSFSLLKYILSSNGNELKKVRSESELIDDNTVLDFIGLVERHGYPAEEHKVITDDGYIITIHRVPYSPISNNTTKKPVVFIQHGLLTSSDLWVLWERERNLPFLLADKGYDVWIGNWRGNSYCRSHVNMTTENPNFWKFSYHDIGLHDIPKSIDYVLDYTNSKKLFYIGYSMGTTISYVMLSMKPSYNDKMRLVISLGPISYFKHKLPPLLDNLMKLVPQFKIMFEENGIYEILPQSKLMKSVGKYLCREKSIALPICTSLLFQISGHDSAQLNESTISYIMNYMPAGASTQSFYHYYQNYLTGNFEAYDYGYEDNLINYKTPKPPIYNVKKIVAPTALIYGLNDALSNEKGVTVLSKKLPNLVTCEAVPYEYFTHFDFFMAKDIRSLLLDRVLKLIQDFNSSLLIIFIISIISFDATIFIIETFLLQNSRWNIPLHFTELSKQHGYVAEEHMTITEDGYILFFHRILDSPKSNITNEIKPVVLLLHGALGCSNIWILFDSERSLAYLLADAGFDVWLGNTRGNIYGQGHVNFSTIDKEFWQYSIHEIALYDYPAVIDYILNYTKSERLYLIGHSMGTTASYILLSMKPIYNEKVQLLVSLAPVAYLRKSRFPFLIKIIVGIYPSILVFLEMEEIYGIKPNSFFNKILYLICSKESFLQFLCIFVTSTAFGLDPSYLNTTDLKTFYQYYPSGGSHYVMNHFVQNINLESFRQYDYGYENNLKQYKQHDLQEYDLTKITTPVALIYGKNDTFIDKKSLCKLYKSLPNAILKAVPRKYFSHMDFVLSKDLKTVVNDFIVKLLK